MPSGVPVRSNDVIKTPLPDLRIGPGRTASDALHNSRFIGPLQPWADFVGDVRRHSDDTTWSKEILAYRHKVSARIPEANMAAEHTRVGDEGGVRGRFNEQVGQAVSAVCRAAGIDMSFGDYKATRPRAIHGTVPDTVVLTSLGNLRAVGEIKVPCIAKHQLVDAAVQGRLRRIIGQISMYMWQGRLKYGFISTYEWTIFLKQEMEAGSWVLYYSEPIAHDSQAGDTTVTLRECFWFISSKAAGEFQANNSVALNFWVS